MSAGEQVAGTAVPSDPSMFNALLNPDDDDFETFAARPRRRAAARAHPDSTSTSTGTGTGPDAVAPPMVDHAADPAPAGRPDPDPDPDPESAPDPAPVGADGVPAGSPAAGAPRPHSTGSTGRGPRDRAGRRARAEQLRSPEQRTQPVVLHVPFSAAAAAKVYAREIGITLAEVVIRAIEASQDSLPTMFVDPAPPPGRGALFAPRPGVRPRPIDEPRVQMQVQLLPAEITVLDQVVEQYQAPSRAQLVGQCLQLFLRSAPRPPAEN